MTNIPCPKCGGETEYKAFKSKKGNDVKGWFCVKEKGECDGVEWVSDKRERVIQPKPTQQDASVMVAMRETYTLIKAAYLVIMEKQAVPPEEALKWLEDKIVELKEKK